MDLPIIADLDNGWYLAAHRNGACIVDHNVLSVLWGDMESDSIPQDVRRKAVEAFERFAWPRIKAEFYAAETGLDVPE